MDKNYTKEFQKEIVKRHIMIAIISTMVILLFYLFLDYFYNGSIIDLITLIFGWDFANFVLKNQKVVVFMTLLIALLCNSLLVEVYAIQKISRVFSSIKILFRKDNQRIVLEDSLKELETDLNDLKQENIENEKRAIQEAQHKVDMIAYLAHDIRTPLASVIGYLSLLNETDLPEDLRKKYTQITLDKANRLETLVNEFFDITKLNQTYLPMQKEDICLCYLFEQMKEEFYPLLSENNQTLNIDIDKDLMIFADAQKIARVFNNIIKNAMYYGDEYSIINISAKQDQVYVHVYFQNQGPTIPQDKLDTIFEQFYRLDSSRSSSTGGSGLGLSIAKMIVNQHQGFIKAISQNHQTTFAVIIPRKDTF